MKSTNSISLVTGNTYDTSKWNLFNNVIPHLKENTGQNTISMIQDGENGKIVTAKMADPGEKERK